MWQKNLDAGSAGLTQDLFNDKQKSRDGENMLTKPEF